MNDEKEPEVAMRVVIIKGKDVGIEFNHKVESVLLTPDDAIIIGAKIIELGIKIKTTINIDTNG